MPTDPSALRVQLDPASVLPSLESVLHDVQVLLQSNGYVGLVLIDLQPLSEIEAECGSEVYNTLIARIASEVSKLHPQVVRTGDLLCSVRSYSEQIAVFLEGARWGATPTEAALEAVADRVWSALAPRVAELTRPFHSHHGVRLGYALALPNPMIQFERIVYRALDQARVMAEDFSRRLNAKGRERLRDLIVSRQLTSAFQPIVEMDSTQVQAYEALIRGPAGSDLAMPAMLFDLATDTDLLAELDRACCDTTFDSARSMPEGALLFANVLPSLINDPEFRARLLDRARTTVEPQRIVLELNEGVAIKSYEVLSKGIDELRSCGIRLAVDDLGAGYANLDHVLRLRPDFLKLDISLVRDVHKSAVKQALIESMVAVGKAVSSVVIAEGIEDPAERETLRSLGVKWGQGFLFARPGPGFGRVSSLANDA
ncbi:MAG: EAL domain-containing protein [Myxococcota bacterium]